MLANPKATNKLYFYDVSSKAWSDASASCSPAESKVVGNLLQVNVCHLTQFAVYDMNDGSSTTEAVYEESSSNVLEYSFALVVAILISLFFSQ